jgi:hypothetical protein
VTVAREARGYFRLPVGVFLLVWLPGSLWNAWDFARRVRFPGPGSDSLWPFVDAWTTTAFGWAPVGFFAAVTALVIREWLRERRDKH